MGITHFSNLQLSELSLQRLWRPRGSIARPGFICGQRTSCNPSYKMWNASKVCHIFSCQKIKSSLFCINRLRQSSEGSGMAWQVCVTLRSLLPEKIGAAFVFPNNFKFVLYLSPINLGCGFALLPQPQPLACVTPQPLNFPGFGSSTCRQYDEMLTNIDAARPFFFFFFREAVFETGR